MAMPALHWANILIDDVLNLYKVQIFLGPANPRTALNTSSFYNIPISFLLPNV